MINGKSAISRLSLGLLVLAPVGVAMVVSTGACGGGQTPPAAATVELRRQRSSSERGLPRASSAAPRSPPEAPSAAPSAAPAPAPAGSKKATKKNDATWASCHQSYKANNKEVAKDVEAMAKGCAKVTKMKLVGKTETGNQGDQDPPQSFPLKA